MFAIKKILVTTLLFFTAYASLAERVVEYHETKIANQEKIKFYFAIDSYEFSESYSTNRRELAKLDSIMNDKYMLVGLDSLELIATASIDGLEHNNALLSERRVKTMSRVLSERYPQIDSSLLTIVFVHENWKDLREDIEANPYMPYKREVLRIIDSERKADTKEWLLKTMRDGEVWKYLRNYILPRQRYGASMVFFYNIHREQMIRKIEEPIIDTIHLEPHIIRDTVELRDTVYLLDKKYRPIALKTNLIYDALGAVNLELEIPIGKRWSVGAELIYPWWFSNELNFTERIRQGHLSLTYWLGDRNKWDYLTGWNIGVFGGYGDHDIQLWDKEGVQGDLINTGINVGFAHTINKKGNLHLHYQLGFGYSRSDYREYSKYWDTKYGDVKVFQYPWEVKRRTWIGPTQAEISLVWMINLGRNKSFIGHKKEE